ncbi:hypothetical protein I7X12_09575 [Halosimplex litoreum]|uniref:Uncharacterized protein n=1 Tax=Halosimplex litoreum TaxID=1198301 RepID=A0A7U3WB31_9EURY|nr:hypothetical protein [Halosimplex litoreum]QPV64826.1 hypothetical protein I7X12_09575 [Halosimplex litoreum]
MTGDTHGTSGATEGPPLGTLDPDSVERIDVHLKRALDTDDTEEKNFHVRHARQLLEACRE